MFSLAIACVFSCNKATNLYKAEGQWLVEEIVLYDEVTITGQMVSRYVNQGHLTFEENNTGFYEYMGYPRVNFNWGYRKDDNGSDLLVFEDFDSISRNQLKLPLISLWHDIQVPNTDRGYRTFSFISNTEDFIRLGHYDHTRNEMTISIILTKRE